MQEFIKKVAKVQSELKAPKNQRNNFGGYNYRSCEDILEAVKPLLTSQGLVLTVCDEIVQVGERYYVKATATITDGTNSINNVAFAREEESKKGMDASQITGATSSYARKYALNGLLCIDDTKDADATNTHGKTEPVQPKVVKKELTAEEKAKQIKEKVQAMIVYIKGLSVFEEGGEEYKKAISFAQKINEMGYTEDANKLMETIDTCKFNKDSIPF